MSIVLAFDGEGSLTFGNDFARDVVIFGVNNIRHLILIIEKHNLLKFRKIYYQL